MYHGFIGPLPILHCFFNSDGEQSYILTELEMFVHLFVLAATAFIFIRLNKRPT